MVIEYEENSIKHSRFRSFETTCSHVGFDSAVADDTTATTVAAIIYNLAKNLPVLDKFLSELRTADISDRPRYAETIKLPYLNAIVEDSMRRFPAATLPMRAKGSG